MSVRNPILPGGTPPAWWLILVLTLALSLLLACTDEEPTDNGDDNDNAGDVTDVGEDVDSTTEDTGSEEDVGSGDTGPEFPPDCDEIECGDDELCYHGACFARCEGVLDCEDDEHCALGRCAQTHCDDLECSEGTACFRGQCYDECARTEQCGQGGGITCEDGACVPLDDQCEGLECNQVDCGEGETTMVTGTVHIPAGDLPLSGATVYVPTTEVEDLPEGATTKACEDMISGDPLIQTITDKNGEFELPNFPVAEDVPLVVQLGKWRREVEVTGLEACEDHELDDEDIRLPQNQSEGNMPRIAVGTGGCDNLECLILKAGVDASEFTNQGYGGTVTIFDTGTGPSYYVNGTTFDSAQQWWDDYNNMVEYDMFLDSCECMPRPDERSDLANLAFVAYLNAGGRVFLSHFQHVWLTHGVQTMQDVVDFPTTANRFYNSLAVDTSHPGGQEMEDWLDARGVLDSDGHFIGISNVGLKYEILEPSALQWIHEPNEDYPFYFSFNMPMGTTGDDAFGRAVYAPLHVTDGNSGQFPTNCNAVVNTETWTDEEIAMAYLLFDLSSCIAPECEPAGCEDVKGQCGLQPDGCGGTIDCGPCCVGLESSCDDDGECCAGLWCDADTGDCVNH